jgi:hypothetical protein
VAKAARRRAPKPHRKTPPAARAPRKAEPSGISQHECAQRLGLSTRQITNLVDEGMPRTSRLGKPEYPWPESLHWYIEWKTKKAVEKSGGAKGEVWKRKAELEIQLAELAVAKAQGQVITIDFAAAQWEKALFLLRARAVAAPDRWMDEFVALPDAKSAKKKLDELIAELLTTLSDAGDDESFDDVDDREPETEEAAQLSA